VKVILWDMRENKEFPFTILDLDLNEKTIQLADTFELEYDGKIYLAVKTIYRYIKKVDGISASDSLKIFFMEKGDVKEESRGKKSHENPNTTPDS